MPIETICQGCGNKLRVGDEHAGKKARCPGCGNIYTVPEPSITSYTPGIPPMPEAPAGPPPVPDAPPQPAKGEPGWMMKIDDGREFGPVDRATLDQWYAEGRIGVTTQLKQEHAWSWQPAASVYPSLAAAPGRGLAANPFSEQPGGVSPYASPNATGSFAQPHRGGLILALALISWFTGCFLVGLVAWILASGDLRKMRSGEMDNSGYGLTQAGMIIGIIHTGMGALITGFVVLLFLVEVMG